MNKENISPSESTAQILDWDNRGKFTEADINSLLTNDYFVSLVTQALARTNVEGHRIFGRLLGQEFGFIGLGQFSQENRGLHLSPLFEGQEGSIDLELEAINYHLRKPEIPTFNTLHFHTHTHLWPQVNREILGDTNLLLNEEDIFSKRDLASGFYNYTRLRNPGFIDILGTEKDGIGQLTLITFGSADAYLNYNPNKVHDNSRRLLASESDPLEAYRIAGINASRISINLKDNSPLNKKDIESASMTLSQVR